MNNGEAYKMAMCKTAAISMQGIGKVLAHDGFTPALKGISMAIGATALGANIMSTIFRKIDNDTRCKAIIEDLAAHDPLLKDVDREQLKEWYATMYYYAPTMAADKATARDILQGFARFGKLDVKTLQMLADTEDKLQKIKSNSFMSNLAPKISL